MKQSQKLTKETTDPYFEEWKRIKTDVVAAHQKRTPYAAVGMGQGIQLFTALLDECGGDLLPLNCQDRLNFIKAHPANFAAFRQMDELFIEMKKTIASKRSRLTRENN